MKQQFKILFELTKIRITSFVTITTLFGYTCYSQQLSWNLAFAILGTLLLASGSAILNHVQEYKTDALMERTKNRPIPSGKISAKDASFITLFFVLIGLILLSLNGFIPFFLGMLNLFWYNAVYTPLKKISRIAILPGSLVGAIPPAIGWTSAGGYIFDTQILVIAFFFFIWQIPHFWLLLLMLGKDYERTGFPTITQTLDVKQLSRITFVWIIATVVTSLLIPVFGVVRNPILFAALLAAGIWLTWKASRFLSEQNQKMNFRFAFREINIFVVLVMLIISLDQLLILF